MPGNGEGIARGVLGDGLDLGGLVDNAAARVGGAEVELRVASKRGTHVAGFARPDLGGRDVHGLEVVRDRAFVRHGPHGWLGRGIRVRCRVAGRNVFVQLRPGILDPHGLIDRALVRFCRVHELVSGQAGDGARPGVCAGSISRSEREGMAGGFEREGIRGGLEERQRHGTRARAGGVVVVFPGLRDRDCGGLGHMHVGDRELVGAGALNDPRIARRHCLINDVNNVFAVIDCGKIKTRACRIVGPGIARAGKAHRHGVDGIAACIGEHGGCRAVGKLRRDGGRDGLRTDAVLVVRVVPNLGDGKIARSGRVGVGDAQLARIGSGLGRALRERDRCGLVGRGIACDRGLLDGVGNRGAVLVHGQAGPGDGAAICRVDRARLNAAHERAIGKEVDRGLCAEARRVIVVVPGLGHGDRARLGRVGVRDGEHLGAAAGKRDGIRRGAHLVASRNVALGLADRVGDELLVKVERQAREAVVRPGRCRGIARQRDGRDVRGRGAVHEDVGLGCAVIRGGRNGKLYAPRALAVLVGCVVPDLDQLEVAGLLLIPVRKRDVDRVGIGHDEDGVVVVHDRAGGVCGRDRRGHKVVADHVGVVGLVDMDLRAVGHAGDGPGVGVSAGSGVSQHELCRRVHGLAARADGRVLGDNLEVLRQLASHDREVVASQEGLGDGDRVRLGHVLDREDAVGRVVVGVAVRGGVAHGKVVDLDEIGYRIDSCQLDLPDRGRALGARRHGDLVAVGVAFIARELRLLGERVGVGGCRVSGIRRDDRAEVDMRDAVRVGGDGLDQRALGIPELKLNVGQVLARHGIDLVDHEVRVEGIGQLGRVGDDVGVIRGAGTGGAGLRVAGGHVDLVDRVGNLGRGAICSVGILGQVAPGVFPVVGRSHDDRLAVIRAIGLELEVHGAGTVVARDAEKRGVAPDLLGRDARGRGLVGVGHRDGLGVVVAVECDAVADVRGRVARDGSFLDRVDNLLAA